MIAIILATLLALGPAPAEATMLAQAPQVEPVEGEATWYCLAGVSRCTSGFAEGGLFAAVSEDLGIEPGSRVEVCHGEACVTVRVIDTCSGCDRTIDLYAAAFARVASLGSGRVPVRLRVLQPGIFGDVAVAVGHQRQRTGAYARGLTVVVPPRTYVTIRVDVGPEFAGFPVEFWQRNGRDGAWTRRTIGRVDGAGYVHWSTLPPRLPGTGYARYVYYRARFAERPTIPETWSPGLGRVVVRAE